MAVNVGAMRKDKEARDAASKRGADWFNIDAGETLLYICPPCRDEDELPYIQLVVHFGIGPKNRMLPSLDVGINKILLDPRVIEVMQGREGFEVPNAKTVCPMSKEYERLDAAGDEKARDDIKRNNRFLFNVIPIRKRKSKTDDWEELPGDKVMPMMVGKTVWDGILEVFFEEGDITDPNKAVLIRISKEGTGMSTRYKVAADSATIRDPYRLTKPQKAACREALKDGGSGDFYKMVGEMVVDAPTAERMIAGVEEEPEEEAGDTAPSCFGKDYEGDDDECGGCPWRGLCAPKCGEELSKDHALKPGDKGYEDKGGGKASGGKASGGKAGGGKAGGGKAKEEPPPKPKTGRAAFDDDDDDDGGLDALERELEAASGD